MSWNVWVAVAVFALILWFTQRRRPALGEEARRRVAAGAKLVDVRTPAEFAAGHLPSAVNVPVDELARRASELGATSTPVVVYCRSGARSGSAARALASAGFGNVFDLGSMRNW